jgi:hypothetical protein
MNCRTRLLKNQDKKRIFLFLKTSISCFLVPVISISLRSKNFVHEQNEKKGFKNRKKIRLKKTSETEKSIYKSLQLQSLLILTHFSGKTNLVQNYITRLSFLLTQIFEKYKWISENFGADTIGQKSICQLAFGLI